jgi:hypothetical protein
LVRPIRKPNSEKWQREYFVGDTGSDAIMCRLQCQRSDSQG